MFHPGSRVKGGSVTRLVVDSNIVTDYEVGNLLCVFYIVRKNIFSLSVLAIL